MLIETDAIVRIRTIYQAIRVGTSDPSCAEIRGVVYDAFLSWYALLADGEVSDAGLIVPDAYVTYDVELIVDAAELLFVNRRPCTGQSNDLVTAAAARVIAIKPAHAVAGWKLGLAAAGFIVVPMVLGAFLGKIGR